MIKNFVFGGNYFARGEFVLYINHSGKYIEINFNMKIPFLCRSVFALLSSIAPVSCAFFPAPVFFLLSFVASPTVV